MTPQIVLAVIAAARAQRYSQQSGVAGPDKEPLIPMIPENFAVLYSNDYLLLHRYDTLSDTAIGVTI
ncbi:MAG: hypothetical protein DRH32_07175 [Deltaproteobacteria bacterium]|nr:MAG: hypothetical protein DRH32_07175 [Deltaproteobacteria bacterium]